MKIKYLPVNMIKNIKRYKFIFNDINEVNALLSLR